MTRNEKIAEKMGWENCMSHKWCIYDEQTKSFYSLSNIGTDTPAGHWLAHLLIERMVGDGWAIGIKFFPDISGCIIEGFWDDDFSTKGELDEVRVRAADFPAAVFELFCKVFDIRED